jgi:hypothetical protein
MYLKPALIALVALCPSLTASAQKLPNKQETSLSIPANVKINGKADEWNNKYQAYNGATQLKYTIANNDKNLYIIVRADEYLIVLKALGKGITVTISSSTQSDVKVGVTYPLQDRVKDVIKHPSIQRTDSVVKEMNAKLSAGAKEMKITGIKDITAAETSIYNEYDIQIAAAMDANDTYTAELIIPLKYINMEGQSGKTLKYDIQLNAPLRQARLDPTVKITQLADGKMTLLSNADGTPGGVSIDTKSWIIMSESLNFTGEYKLK